MHKTHIGSIALTILFFSTSQLACSGETFTAAAGQGTADAEVDTAVADTIISQDASPDTKANDSAADSSTDSSLDASDGAIPDSSLDAADADGQSDSSAEANDDADGQVTVDAPADVNLCVNVVCAAPDQCHEVGLCNPVTGECTNPAKSDGKPCDDGNACSQTDTCKAGICKGENPIVCGVPDQCHEQGQCDASTGQCTNPKKANGAICSDSNLCTKQDKCEDGVCKAGDPVVCAAADQCHDAGTCAPSTGECSSPVKSDGAWCDDKSLCTQTDSCQAGVCKGANPIQCAASDQCHQGSCNPADGQCVESAKANGAACSDGNLCTQTDTCQSGVCKGVNPIVCEQPDQCHSLGTCNAATGKCSTPAKADYTACDDGNGCSKVDVCISGTCMGTAPVVCAPLSQCHQAGSCDSNTGLCSNPTKDNGTTCSDGTACTQKDTCQNGLCTGTNPIVCAAVDDCHQAGECLPGNGTCTKPAKADGALCDLGHGVCQGGTCTGNWLFNPISACETFKIPADGTYTIEAAGAQGGPDNFGALGGLGARASGGFVLKAGDVINIVVGTRPVNQYNGGGGGGGGTFVYMGGTCTDTTAATVLVISGGGAGGSGTPGRSVPEGGSGAVPGGLNGNGGGAYSSGSSFSYSAAGGTGWLSAGAAGSMPTNAGGGQRWAGGLGGNYSGNYYSSGGFGGGGAASIPQYASGGGGGYSGGSGGVQSGASGGGGGSFNAGSNPVTTANLQSGSGYAKITRQ